MVVSRQHGGSTSWLVLAHVLPTVGNKNRHTPLLHVLLQVRLLVVVLDVLVVVLLASSGRNMGRKHSSCSRGRTPRRTRSRRRHWRRYRSRR